MKQSKEVVKAPSLEIFQIVGTKKWKYIFQGTTLHWYGAGLIDIFSATILCQFEAPGTARYKWIT